MAAPDENKRESLPFEPRQKKKKNKTQSTTSPQRTQTATAKSEASLSAIPDVVSKRMIRRMALLSGIPTALGVASLFAFYWVASQKIFVLPPYAAVLVSSGFFGLGVLGLSYGLFSASWDEDRIGNWLGFDEFKLNFSRTTAAWRSARSPQEPQE
ncbi:MAG: PAM68 family protein [Jaaginema sp. PMC 1079.18]|nr:PAM68 family protein [Jaaginema sp. PMC 1080.18]MEC4849931.1 PAM68 family protein [Jaaginema sp. PMC 1079.18]MEC4865172.1 PAM68 family protein [Jaaginema sp. PMC 1078.18]